MIKYTKGIFGLNLLGRVHGSAIYRAVLPAILASVAYILIHHFWEQDRQSVLLHPYAAGVLIGGITFLLVFRVTQSYQRYCKFIFFRLDERKIHKSHFTRSSKRNQWLPNSICCHWLYSQGRLPGLFTECKANGWTPLSIPQTIICSTAFTMISDLQATENTIIWMSIA